MREILFRGRKENGRWVYGGYYRLFQGLQMDGNHYSHYIVENNHHHKVDPKTVGQWSGLESRDGRKIFENDIYQYNFEIHYGEVYKERKHVDVVKFEGGAFSVGIFLLHDALENDDEAKIIGNIYDNPQLLGGERE